MAWTLLESNCNGQVLKAWNLATLSQRPSVDTNRKARALHFILLPPVGWFSPHYLIYTHTLSPNPTAKRQQQESIYGPLIQNVFTSLTHSFYQDVNTKFKKLEFFSPEFVLLIPIVSMDQKRNKKVKSDLCLYMCSELGVLCVPPPLK